MDRNILILAERRGFEPAMYAQSFIVTYIITYF